MGFHSRPQTPTRPQVPCRPQTPNGTGSSPGGGVYGTRYPKRCPGEVTPSRRGGPPSEQHQQPNWARPAAGIRPGHAAHRVEAQYRQPDWQPVARDVELAVDENGSSNGHASVHEDMHEAAVHERAQTPTKRRPHSAADLSGAHAIATSPDEAAVFVVGRDGIMQFRVPSLEFVVSVPYAGSASAGYADVAVGKDRVLCVDLKGTLFEHDRSSCKLRRQRPYQPSVVETLQQLVSGRVQRKSVPLIGLEGGLGGASRLAIHGDVAFLGGLDGVVTTYQLGSLSVVARAQLSEGPHALGVRSLYFAPSTRLYCCVSSTVHVLERSPLLQSVAKLRGGPRIPVFGSFCSATETHDGRYAFTSDVGGPAVHMWDTRSWSWLARVELGSNGGAGRHIVVSSDDRVLYVATEWGRFLAFGLMSVPPQCLEDGGQGGPLAGIFKSGVVVLSQKKLHVRTVEFRDGVY